MSRDRMGEIGANDLKPALAECSVNRQRLLGDSKLALF
jgi:hypothetical protein